MTKTARCHHGALFVATSVALVALCLSSCSGNDPSALAGPTTTWAVPTPLATSVAASGGTWATIPMGHLDQLANTFWQLLFRPAKSMSWSDQVEATATATNGGLVLAGGEGRPLVVGVRPSLDLTFTPLVSTGDAARSWSDGLVTYQLAQRPDALAESPSGQVLALVKARGADEVLSSTGNLSDWRPLVSEEALAAGRAGRSCGLSALTAVGFASGVALAAGGCSRPGVVGMFADNEGTWAQAGLALPSWAKPGRTEVLSLSSSGATVLALLAVRVGHTTGLLAARSGRDHHWEVSAPLPLPAGQALASFGPGQGSSLFVLEQAATGDERLFVAGAHGSWQELPSPPPKTGTVGFVGAGRVDAFVSQGDLLTVWSHDTEGPGLWVKGQVLHVAIQYGSSS